MNTGGVDTELCLPRAGRHTRPDPPSGGGRHPHATGQRGRDGVDARAGQGVAVGGRHHPRDGVRDPPEAGPRGGPAGPRGPPVRALATGARRDVDAGRVPAAVCVVAADRGANPARPRGGVGVRDDGGVCREIRGWRSRCGRSHRRPGWNRRTTRRSERCGYAYLPGHSVILLGVVYAKGDKADLSAAERAAVKSLLARFEAQLAAERRRREAANGQQSEA